jgi:hypothetical protein
MSGGIDEDDERAILARTAELQALHAGGDTDTALALHAELVDRYGLAAIAQGMADRADAARLVAEAQLVQMFGADALRLGSAPHEP